MDNNLINHKLLIISHNCLSETDSNGRTLKNFLTDWDYKKIAQFFIYPEVPTIFENTTFFRITDVEIIKSIFSLKPSGTIFQNSGNKNYDQINLSSIDLKIRNSNKKWKAFFKLLRNLIWLTKKWDNPLFNSWLNDFDPEIILYQAGDSFFMNEIAIEISERRNIPLVVYNSEDYYLKNKKNDSIFECINKKIFKRSYEKLIARTQYVIYINEKLKDDYDKYFNVPNEVIMTSSIINEKTNDIEIFDFPKISYLGNVSLERWKSLIDIGLALQNINKDFFLDVYTGTMNPDIIMKLTNSPGIRFQGKINYSEVLKVMKTSSLLIHVESFLDFYKEELKYAFSSKIPDSLSCGVCLFVYGPYEIYCIQYLKENDLACVVTQEQELEIVLRKILFDKALRNHYIENAIKSSKLFHDVKINSKRFYQIIADIIEKS